MGLIWFVIPVSSLFLCYNLQVKFLVPHGKLSSQFQAEAIYQDCFGLKVTIEDDTHIWPHIVIIGPLNGLVNFSPSSVEVTQIQLWAFFFFLNRRIDAVPYFFFKDINFILSKILTEVKTTCGLISINSRKLLS